MGMNPVIADGRFLVAERRLSLAQPLKAGITGPPKTLRRVSDG
jgi:hypothetical protein